MSQLKAPNGKPSNLTPEQWKLVRTPQFKAWFGDWENDTKNASKVVDENGEPLVVYHGTKTNRNFNVFDNAKFGNQKRSYKNGYFFTNNYEVAKSFSKSKSRIFEVFLNIRKPKKINFKGANWEGYDDNDNQKVDYDINTLVSVWSSPFLKKDGLIADNIYDVGDYWNGDNPIGNNYVVFKSEQIKLADGTNTTFDGKNPDIRFAEGGTMNTIQQGDALIYKDSEFLDFDNVIYVEDVSESAHGTIFTLSNGQSMFETQLKKKFRKANEGEINRSNIMSKEIFSKGGKTRRYMKKIKRGGITYGKSHAEGGIPVKNQSTGDMLEVEGGEGIVNKRSMASDKKVKLNGKEMTICEAVSQLNQLEGGVQFSCDDVSDRQFIEAMAKGGELERGTRTEQEHIQVLRDLYAKRITPKQASKRIAKDHLKEDAHYYSKLAKMEGKMANGGKVKNDYNVPSTEDLVDMVANAREKQIKKVKQSGVPIVIGRNDGYYFKTSDSANYSEQILSSRPSKRKVIEIIESNPNITEVYFQGSIRGGDYIGDVDFDIIDDFVVTLWKKPIDVSNTIGTTFQWTETEQDPKNEKKEIRVDPRIYILVKQEDAHIYKDRPTDDKYFYLNSYLEKNGEQSSIRIPKSDFKHLIEEGELETIEVSQALKEQLLKPMKTYAKGGEIFDKETEDLLSDLTKKYAKGGEVVADKTETINMKDFEGYADQYNGRKNKFFKANDEYQLLVNEGMELKNNTTLPQDEKDKLLAELREKAREAKTTLGEKRKDFVDMREVKSPFYAPQLADGGKISKIDRGDGETFKIKLKHPYLPSKGIDVYLNIDSQSLRGVMSFTIGTRNIDVLYPKEVIIDVLEKTGLKSSSFQVFGTKEAKSLKVSIHFNFIITLDNFSYLSMEILKALTSNKYYESILDKKKEIPIPPTEKEDDWNWRFKTMQELKDEYGWEKIEIRIKDGNLFATNMFFLLGKKINETQEAVEAISKINQNTYGGVETLIQKQLGIQTPTKDSFESWNISSWMITNKPLAGEAVPPTEEKKEISEKDVQNEVFRWCEEKAKEKKDINERKYQTSNLIDWIFLNQNGGSMVQFSELIAMAKQSEKLQKELGRLANDEGLPIDGFVMQLLYKKIIQSVEEIKSQIMLFVLFESEVREQLDTLVFHIPYLAELDTFDKDYIIHIK